MKKFSKKGVLLFGVMAVCVMAVPSMASALSWSPVGGADHGLLSTNLAFTTETPVIGSSCAFSTLTGVVDSAADLTITAATFTNCMGHAMGVNCTVTATGGNFPWTATATNPVVIHRVDVGVVFENTPGNPTACQAPITATVTGSLNAGTFNNTEHGITINEGTGLFAHSSVLGTQGVTVTGTLRDERGTLALS